MVRLIAATAVALAGMFNAGEPLAQDRNNGNGAMLGKAGYLLDIIASDRCPNSAFQDSNRHRIAVQTSYTGNGTDETATVNRIYLQKGSDFRVRDGNACDDGAYFQLPITDVQCIDCGEPAPEPTFTEYEVYARLVGKSGSGATVASCVEVIMIDPVTAGETSESLCSLGQDNLLVEARTVDSGKERNKWQNVSKALRTVCIDTVGDGVCDTRVGLFDPLGEDYWWHRNAQRRPQLQLVLVAALSGSS